MSTVHSQLAAELKTKSKHQSLAVLVIDGDCAAGKTTLAAQVAAKLDCNVFHLDDFFLPQRLRTEERLTEPGGNVDYERFAEQVLAPLIKNKPFTYGAYSCADGSTSPVEIMPQPVAIIEGSYALHPCFLETYKALDAVKVFLRIDPQEQLRRIAERNGDAMLKRFQQEWIPMEKQYQQAYAQTWEDVRFTDV